MSRWPLIRHARWLYLSIRFALWWNVASQIFVAPNQGDIDFLDAVWRGDA